MDVHMHACMHTHTHCPSTHPNPAGHSYEAVQVESALSGALSIVPVKVEERLEVVQQSIHAAHIPKCEVREDPHEGLADGWVGLLVR